MKAKRARLPDGPARVAAEDKTGYISWQMMRFKGVKRMYERGEKGRDERGGKRRWMIVFRRGGTQEVRLSVGSQEAAAPLVPVTKEGSVTRYS